MWTQKVIRPRKDILRLRLGFDGAFAGNDVKTGYNPKRVMQLLLE